MKKDMKEIRIMASRNQYLEFKKSFIWKDIVNELEAWKEGFGIEQDALVDDIAESNPSTASVLTHLGSLDGRRKAVNYMIGIVDMFISILEDPKNDTRRNKANRSRTGS